MQVCWQSCMQHQLGFCNISRFEAFFFLLCGACGWQRQWWNHQRQLSQKNDEKWGHVVSSVLVIVLTQRIKCYRNLQLNLRAIYKKRVAEKPHIYSCWHFNPPPKWDGISIHPIAENLPVCETSLNQNPACVCAGVSGCHFPGLSLRQADTHTLINNRPLAPQGTWVCIKGSRWWMRNKESFLRWSVCWLAKGSLSPLCRQLSRPLALWILIGYLISQLPH